MNSKEKKKILLQFSQINRRIQQLNSEIEKLWSAAVSVGNGINQSPNTSINGTKTERAVERLEQAEYRLEIELEELYALQARIIKSIQKLPDIRERQILHYAYIGEFNGKEYIQFKFWEIAIKLNYSEIRIKQLHGTALLHLKI